MPKKSMCVAVDMNGGFGFQGTIPWNIPGDFKHFKSTVKNGVCICGTTTFTDMYNMSVNGNGKLFKNCLINTTPHIIVSSSIRENADPELVRKMDDCTIEHYLVNSVEAAVKLSKDLYPDLDTWFIGGQSIFNQGLDYCDELLVTVIPACYTCDKWFPTAKMMDMFNPSEVILKIHDDVVQNIKVIKWIRKQRST